jgi:hypothetical protein
LNGIIKGWGMRSSMAYRPARSARFAADHPRLSNYYERAA